MLHVTGFVFVLLWFWFWLILRPASHYPKAVGQLPGAAVTCAFCPLFCSLAPGCVGQVANTQGLQAACEHRNSDSWMQPL